MTYKEAVAWATEYKGGLTANDLRYLRGGMTNG